MYTYTFSFYAERSYLVVSALLQYLQSRDGIPNPRGALSLSAPSSAIAEANREIQEATSETKKWGPYMGYSATVRAEIGKHASRHGVAAGMPQLAMHVSVSFPGFTTWDEATIQCFR